MSPSWAKPARMPQEVYEGIVVAQRLRRELRLDGTEPIGCIVGLAEERLGLDVVLAPLQGGISGFYLPFESASVVVVDQSHPVQRQRFTIAHEVGHHALGHAAAPRIHAEEAAEEEPATAASNAHLYRPQRARNAEERAADAFAGELLTPHEGAKRVIARWHGEPPLDLTVRLSAHFGASAASALVRLQTLGVVDWRGARAVRREFEVGAHLERYAALELTPLDDQLQRHADAGGGPRCAPRARRAIRASRFDFDALA